MYNTYKNFETNVYTKLPASVVYNNTERRNIINTLDNNIVGTVPGRRGKAFPVRVYKDFEVTQTKSLTHINLFKVVYIPTGEIVADDAFWNTIGWFIWWWYNGRG